MAPPGRHLDWDKLRVFHAVAQAGSFTRAGEQLNLSQSAVSRQISALEESLSVALFHRHARGLILTEPGEALYETAHDVSGKLAIAEALIGESRDKPSGELKITTTVGFGSLWLTPRLGEFLELYPEINVALQVDDHELDLSMREADVGIRMRPSTQPDLVQRRLMRMHHHIYASQAYVQKHGVPQTAADLDNHRLIVWGANVPSPVPEVNWLLHSETGAGVRRAVLRVNSVQGLMISVETGVGIASLPDYLARDPCESGLLTRILPDVEGPAYDIYFVYPEELRNTKRITTFRDFIVDKVAEWQF
jgi:DNA-binding transcriptional LysR family regulator